MGRGHRLVQLAVLCAWTGLPVVAASQEPPAPDAGLQTEGDTGTAAPATPDASAASAPAPSTSGEPAASDAAGAPAQEPASPVAPTEPVAAPAPAPEAATPTAPSTDAAPSAPGPTPVDDAIELAPPASLVAAPAQASDAPEPDTVARRAPDAPMLYVRLAAGMGFPFGFDVSDHYSELSEDRARFSGLTFATELMIGAPLAEWIAVGGGAVSDTVTSGEVKERDGNTRDLDRSLYLGMIGPFVDIYPAAPAGFHAQALIGFAHLSRARNLGDNEAVGPGAAIAVGYEWRASSRWNVGALGRMTVAPLSMDPVDGVSRSPVFYQPTILITATMQP